MVGILETMQRPPQDPPHSCTPLLVCHPQTRTCAPAPADASLRRCPRPSPSSWAPRPTSSRRCGPASLCMHTGHRHASALPRACLRWAVYVLGARCAGLCRCVAAVAAVVAAAACGGRGGGQGAGAERGCGPAARECTRAAAGSQGSTWLGRLAKWQILPIVLRCSTTTFVHLDSVHRRFSVHVHACTAQVYMSRRPLLCMAVWSPACWLHLPLLRLGTAAPARQLRAQSRAYGMASRRSRPTANRLGHARAVHVLTRVPVGLYT